MQTQSRTFLENLTTSTPAFNLQAFTSCQEVTPETVDKVVDIEMKELMARYTAEEEIFVEQKLLENPVVCERRSSVRSSTDSSSSSRDPLQQQRAESCRKSRINNKIKKAKSKFRHKFITMKLAQNAATLECLRDVIKHAEARLRSNGVSEETLENLRKRMGVDRMEIENLSEITKQLTNATDN